MSLFATERVPSPYIVTGVVDVDVASRILAVRLSDLEHGYGRLLWKAAHQQLRASEENGYRTGPPTLWASADGGGLRVAHVTPGDFGMLLARFPQGEAAFSGLVGKPGLTAAVGIDRSTHLFISVRFKHRS